MMLNGEQLPRSGMVKCLGVWIHDGLTWKKQVDELLLWTEVIGCTANNGKMKVYCALVLPHLDYCSQEYTKLAWMA